MRVRPNGPLLTAFASLALMAPFPQSASAVAQGQGGPNSQLVAVRLDLQVTATPEGSLIAWRAVPGATRYVVHRWKRLANQSRCCEAHVPAGTALRHVDTSLPGAGSYLYRVVAHLQGGRRGYEERTLQVGAPTVGATPPAGVSAEPASPVTDPGRASPPLATIDDPDRLRDLPQRMRPGVGPASAPPTGSLSPSDPAPSTPTGGTPVVDLPHRDHRISIPLQSIPLGGGDPADGSRQPATSGRYLVTVTGLRAGSVTTDNMLHEDGRGDEVFAAAFIRRYDLRTATVVETTKRQTMVYGDAVRRLNERVQAGRLSSMGGIADGDPIPDAAPVARSLPAQESVFPWKLWEGTLTDGADALVISPSIWEYDGRPALFHAWVANQSALNGTLFLRQQVQDQIKGKVFGPLRLNPTDVTNPRQLENNAIGMIPYAFGIPVTLNEGEDRPIGLTSGPSLPNTSVVLTREIIEAALATPPKGVENPMPSVLIPLTKPGIMVINFEDQWRRMFTDRLAFYSMVLQVERIP